MKRAISDRHAEQLTYARSRITAESMAQAVAKRNRPLVERLAKFRIIRGADDCWGWTGATVRHGYPRLAVNKKLYTATHIALLADGRPRPSADHCACHTCDNPECTNPRHLWWGTRSENTRDAVRKGRLRPANRKLSDEDVRSIRNSPENARILAERYGVSKRLIFGIRSGEMRDAA